MRAKEIATGRIAIFELGIDSRFDSQIQFVSLHRACAENHLGARRGATHMMRRVFPAGTAALPLDRHTSDNGPNGASREIRR